MVRGVVVGDGLEEGLGVVAEGQPAGVHLGLVRGGGPGGGAVVLVLLLVVVVVDLAGLQAPREDGRLEPLWERGREHMFRLPGK